VRQFNLHKEEAFAPLHNKVDLLEDLLGVAVISSIGNNYEGHNKPPKVQELNQHVLMECKILHLLLRTPKAFSILTLPTFICWSNMILCKFPSIGLKLCKR
jgi:hypothetical protein